MERLVYYSLSLPDDDPRPDLVWQLDLSLGTLRRFNWSIPVALFLSGPMSQPLASVCSRHSVMVHDQPRYEHRIAASSPTGWPALRHYPLLHRFMNFREICRAGPAQVMYLDCDTVFFNDIELLFERYEGFDIAAREEAHTSRSALGPDTEFLDEQALMAIAQREGAHPIPPFNLGVVLFDGGLCDVLAQLEAVFVDYVWRFVTWMAGHPVTGAAIRYGEFLGFQDAVACATQVDHARALPYPSANRWIVDEIALWLTLGHVPGIRTADFHHSEVGQNGELLHESPRTAPWVVCHYFSQNTDRVERWLASHVGSRRSESFMTT